jgi:hypothetical protein
MYVELTLLWLIGILIGFLLRILFSSFLELTFIRLVLSLDQQLKRYWYYHLIHLSSLLILKESDARTLRGGAGCRASRDRKLLHLKAFYSNSLLAEILRFILSLLENSSSFIYLFDLFKEVTLLSSFLSLLIIYGCSCLWLDFLKNLFFFRGPGYWTC